MHSDYVYHDRKMMKWMPFNALLEQGDYIRDLLEGRERMERPVLSRDQEEELNYKLEMAYVFHQTIEVSYYESYQIKTITGTITRTDIMNKLIYIGETSLPAMTITNIETIE